jgi:Lrp/AsnC family leucine-responsive transcriptional regulator
MRGLDETDREILRMLMADSRQPYSDIAEAVDLSPPAVSDRVDRLQEIGLIERFTLDLDRELLAEGQSLLVRVDAAPGMGETVAERLREYEGTEHVFRTVDDTLVWTLTAPPEELEAVIDDAFDDGVRDYEVGLLADTAWQPALGEADLAPECVECGNTVTREGERETLDGTVYHFCCSSCRGSFLDRYERIEEGA